MTLLFRFVSIALVTSFMAGCETWYTEQPVQPQPSPVYPTQPKVIHKAAPSSVYPSQPENYQAPIAAPVSPPPSSMPVKTAPAAAVPAPNKVLSPSAQPVEDNRIPVVTPPREPGSISELPDPS